MDINEQKERLIETARIAMEKAYAPYSKFKVGAAILTKSGKIYTGCNIENASYGLTICAERVAACSAIADGEKDFVAIGVIADMEKPCPPCGACRQFLAEFNPRMEVIMSNLAGKRIEILLEELLPGAFNCDCLPIE